jgi:hypothetical protein
VGKENLNSTVIVKVSPEMRKGFGETAFQAEFSVCTKVLGLKMNLTHSRNF